MKALILVDIQNDFCPGGALEVPKGDEVVPIANQLAAVFDLVVATQDWHPGDHGSFAAQYPFQKPGNVIDLDGLEQILWPIHCVQGSYGAQFVKDLDLNPVEAIFRKGTDAKIDSYSGFFDNGKRKATGMGGYLKAKGVEEVYVMGLAADYCVKFTALDAVELGFKTHLIQDGTRGVNLQAGDTEKAFQELQEKGVVLCSSDELLAPHS